MKSSPVGTRWHAGDLLPLDSCYSDYSVDKLDSQRAGLPHRAKGPHAIELT